MVLTTGRYGKTMNVGVDLFFIPQRTLHFSGWKTQYKYLYVAVLQTVNYVWAYGMTNKKAVTAMKQAQKLWEDWLQNLREVSDGAYLRRRY